MFRAIFFRQLLGAASLCCFVAAFAVGELRAAVTIQIAEGRVLRGEVDARTTEQHLWIRQEENRITLATQVSWSSVTAAAIDGKNVEVSELLERWPQLASSGSANNLVEAMNLDAGLDEPCLAPRHAPRRIVAIEIEAYLVNLDRDVEPDGLELAIAAFDDRGDSVPVRGSLTARLVGERDEKRSGKIRFEELQRWSQPVELDDFQEGIASYPLRFRLVRPEFDFELIPYALLNVRLGISGEGNFEASIPVMIRHFNPFRDQLQKYVRSRFLPEELTGEVRRRKVAYPGSGLGAWSRH